MNLLDEMATTAASRSSAESAMAVKDTVKDPVVVVVENAVASIAATSTDAVGDGADTTTTPATAPPTADDAAPKAPTGSLRRPFLSAPCPPASPGGYWFAREREQDAEHATKLNDMPTDKPPDPAAAASPAAADPAAAASPAAAGMAGGVSRLGFEEGDPMARPMKLNGEPTEQELAMFQAVFGLTDVKMPPVRVLQPRGRRRGRKQGRYAYDFKSQQRERQAQSEHQKRAIRDVSRRRDRYPPHALHPIGEAVQDSDEGQSNLWHAARRGELEVVQSQAGCNGVPVAQPDSYGATPLWIAAYSGHLEVVQWLASMGGSVTQPDNDGASPLFGAAQENHLAVVQWLARHGGSVSQPDNDGTSPLCVATLGMPSDGASLGMSSDGRGAVLAWLLKC